MGLDISAVHPETEEDIAEARLGCVGAIQNLRSLLAAYPEQFPTILSKVIFSSIHCGDEICDPNIMSAIVEECAMLEAQFGNNARAVRFAASLKSVAETAIAENLILVF